MERKLFSIIFYHILYPFVDFIETKMKKLISYLMKVFFTSLSLTHFWSLFLFYTPIFIGGFSTAGTSKIEIFVITVNGWKPPLTIITKSSILDVAAVLNPPLILYHLWFSSVFRGYKLEHCPEMSYLRQKARQSMKQNIFPLEHIFF